MTSRAAHGLGLSFLRPPSSERLAELLGAQEAMPFTYEQLGATRSELPAGYRHDRWTVDLAPDDTGAFDRASGALRNWSLQRGAGFRVYPGTPPVPNLTFLLVMRLGPVFTTAAGRVVYVVEESNRVGFAYGTLPAHPEQGEEAFTVIREADRLRIEIVAFSRPGHPLVRLGQPLARFLQLRANSAYVEAMRRALK